MEPKTENNSNNYSNLIKKWLSLNIHCNCYRHPYRNIEAECFNTIEDANKSFHNRNKKMVEKLESRLVSINRFYPEFVKKFIIQNAFNSRRIFLSYPNENNTLSDNR